MKKLLLLILILSSIIAIDSCCIFRKIEPTIVTRVDTLLVLDTIEVPVPYEVDDDSTDMQVWADSLSILKGILDSLITSGATKTEIIRYIRITADTARTETSVAFAKAYINKNKIVLNIQNKDDSIEYIYQYYKDSISVIITEQDKNRDTIKELAKDNRKLKWSLIGLCVLIGLLLIAYIRSGSKR